MSKPRSRRFKIERIPITSRDQWLKELRPHDVTASAAPAVFGLHPHKTPFGLFVEKRDRIIDEEETEAMRRGRYLEGAVAALYQDAHPTQAVRKVTSYYRMPELRIGGTPDYVVRDEEGRRAALQIKTVSPHVFKQTYTDETPPHWIVLQTLVETMLLRAEYGIVAAMIVDGYRFDLAEYRIPRHEGAWRKIQDGVAQFWRDIEAGKMPEPMAVDRALLSVMYPKEIAGKVADLSGDNELPGVLDEYLALKAKIAVEVERKAEIEARLIAKMADAAIADIPGWRVTFKQQHRKGYTVEPTDYRVLRIAKDKAPGDEKHF